MTKPQTNNYTSQTQTTLPSSTRSRIFRSAYQPIPKVKLHFYQPSKTKQQFKDECDINKIMARYQQTGLIDFVNQNQARYQDCTGADYQEAMQTIAAANSMFQAMPSALRAEFNNSPHEFVEFCENPENAPRLKELGLLRPDAALGGTPTNQPAAAQPAPAAANPPGPSEAPGT
ncbi:MAG: internal scaffolding protein [Microvirus sp.]|nr:MAG: internal scaffolding protein [Microvirus sp.]